MIENVVVVGRIDENIGTQKRRLKAILFCARPTVSRGRRVESLKASIVWTRADYALCQSNLSFPPTFSCYKCVNLLSSL